MPSYSVKTKPYGKILPTLNSTWSEVASVVKQYSDSERLTRGAAAAVAAAALIIFCTAAPF